MAIIINSNDPLPTSDMEKLWWYNAADCMVTHEVLGVIEPQLDSYTRRTYEFSKALQGPSLEMRLRGVLVDQRRKNEVIDDFYAKIERLESQLERIVLEGVGLPYFNWRSNADLQSLFYTHLGIPPIRRGGRPTVNRDALEKIEQYLIARQIVAHLTTMRDLGKKIAMLKTEIDPDGRMRTSYNIAGTSTGRFSSSFSEFGTGGNLQNVEESLRSVFISDPGTKFAKFDAKSGESFIVGAIEWNLFGDSKYLETCQTGDPHTAAARFCWPEMPWTGDIKKDKAIAEQKYHRHHSYRDCTKKTGHGSNYAGKPETLSMMHKIPLGVVVNFQQAYFKAFPAHLKWHEHVDNTLRKVGTLISLTGRKRQFWGRRNDESVLREAIAYDPQGSLADIVNSAMLNIWSHRDALVAFQDHDAITVMYPDADEDRVIPLIQEQLKFPIQLKHGRTLLIPYDCKVGWNKGDYSEGNPDGLKDYTGHDERKRTPQVSIMDRSLR